MNSWSLGNLSSILSAPQKVKNSTDTDINSKQHREPQQKYHLELSVIIYVVFVGFKAPTLLLIATLVQNNSCSVHMMTL